MYIKLTEEWSSKGIIGPVYLASLFTFSDGIYNIISPQFGGFLANGFSFYDVVLPMSEEGSPYGSAKKRDIIIKQDGSVEIKPASFISPFDTSLSETSYYPLPNYIITKYLWNRVATVELSSTAHPLNKEIYNRLNRGLYVPLVICADGTNFRDSAYYQVVATDDKGSTMRLWAFLYDVGDDYNHKYIIVDLDSEGITTIVEEGERNISEGTSYDDTELNNKVNGLQTQINTLVSGDASAAIESFNEITAFLNGVEDTESLDGIIAGIEQQITNKQDTIADLDTIRSGAALGTTAIQNVKTINGESILGEGDIEIKANVDTSNLATKEELTSLINEMIANEEVHAAAYNDLDSRLKDIGSLISGVAVTKEEFQEGIQSVTNEMIANEEVHAAALNDLNERLIALLARIEVLENN